MTSETQVDVQPCVMASRFIHAQPVGVRTLLVRRIRTLAINATDVLMLLRVIFLESINQTG